MKSTRCLNTSWWNSKGDRCKGINQLRWEKLSQRKENGGMGFQDLKASNMALLGKQGWKIISKPWESYS